MKRLDDPKENARWRGNRNGIYQNGSAGAATAAAMSGFKDKIYANPGDRSGVAIRRAGAIAAAWQ
jgi:hypothetical protein